MYPNIATANQVWALFLMLYEDSYCGVPYKTTTRDSDYERFSYNLQDKISRFNLMNGDKYRRILDTYFFDYDPISNYDMIEEGLDTNTPTGTESMTHSIVGEIDYTELRGPATSSTAIDFSRKKETSITDNSSTSGSNSISYNSSTANSGGVAETLNQKSGSQNKSGGILQVSGNSISINGNGTMPTTTHFTTTFDSTNENETGSDVTKGDAASLDATVSSRSTTDTTSTAHHGSDTTTIGSNSNSTNTTKEDIIPELRIVKGNSEPGYSDVKTFGNRKDEQSHKLTRKGNIGVTTS